MLENHRSGLLWDRFMRNPEIAPALAAVGFVADSGSVTAAPAPATPVALRLAAAPNPAPGAVRFALELPAAGDVRLEVFDLAGRRVATPVVTRLPAGATTVAWNGRGDDGRALGAGVYLARLRAGGATAVVRIVRAE